MHDHDGKLLLKAKRSKNIVYKVSMGKRQCVRTFDLKKWFKQMECKLGHLNLKTIKSSVQRELVLGIPHINFDKKVCGSCLLGKKTWQATSYRVDKIFELIHGDLCGPITLSPVPGNKYIFVFIGDHSSICGRFLGNKKSDAFKKFKSLVEQDSGKRIQTFRTDKWGEFCIT